MVAIQANTRVVDVTGVGVAMSAAAATSSSTTNKTNAAATDSSDKNDNSNTTSDEQAGSTSNKKKRKLTAAEQEAASTSVAPEVPVDSNNITLPKGLSQLEIRVPTDEKDTMTYLFLLKVRI